MVAEAVTLSWDEIAGRLCPEAVSCRELHELLAALYGLAGLASGPVQQHKALIKWSSAAATISKQSASLTIADPERVDTMLSLAVVRFLMQFVCRTPADLLRHGAAILATHQQLLAVARKWSALHRRAESILADWGALVAVWEDGLHGDLHQPRTLTYAMASILRPELVGPDGGQGER